MKQSDRYRICASPDCNGWVAISPRTGGDMIYRDRGKLWGCSHFRGEEQGLRRQRVKFIEAPPRMPGI